jgi:DNA-binding transcriptional ArsR family regulator
VQKHVAVLEKAGLLTKRRQGREALASPVIRTWGAVGRRQRGRLGSILMRSRRRS